MSISLYNNLNGLINHYRETIKSDLKEYYPDDTVSINKIANAIIESLSSDSISFKDINKADRRIDNLTTLAKYLHKQNFNLGFMVDKEVELAYANTIYELEMLGIPKVNSSTMSNVDYLVYYARRHPKQGNTYDKQVKIKGYEGKLIKATFTDSETQLGKNLVAKLNKFMF